MSDPSVERIPFQVEVSQIIELLAKEIYQSPFALLRENAQNAFDAILMREQRGDSFAPKIDITITTTEIVISDNGIGMTRDDLRAHFWRAGASSKNTPEARAAGVVGTFGIGAMANFGIADQLSADTESAITGQRTYTAARRETLSTTEDGIEMRSRRKTGQPGTTIRARLSSEISVTEAVEYIKDFVDLVPIPVVVNGDLVSQQTIDHVVTAPDAEDLRLRNERLSEEVSARVVLRVSGIGEVWAHLDNVSVRGEPIAGTVVLRQGLSSIRTSRSGFGLATVGVSSYYQFGGAADLRALTPTAGREALTTTSIQLLQEIVSATDAAVSERIASRRESDLSAPFMQWARAHRRYELCGKLQARVEPGNQRVTLADLATRSSTRPLLLYAGSDQTMINSLASDDSPLVVLAVQNPRRQLEQEYFARYANVDHVEDAPRVIRERSRRRWTTEEQALVFRIVSILESDYFLPADVRLGELSHGLPILVDAARKPLRVVIDPAAPTFSVVRELHRSDYEAFGSMVKDFVRNIVFPRVADHVPSSTRQGADAFLKSIRKTRDVFEYEAADLQSLSSVWEEYLEGRLSMTEAADRASYIVRRNVQIVDAGATRTVREVVPDVVENEAITQEEDRLPSGPAPPIMRIEIASDAKVLVIEQQDLAVKGYRCFVALSDRVYEDRGEFFLQPHSTSVVWGGQKALFVFEHHSGEFGLYYDLQAAEVVAEESGGGPFPTATIVLKNRIFIPVPSAIASSFIPKAEERKRFEVRSDLLYTEGDAARSKAVTASA